MGILIIEFFLIYSHWLQGTPFHWNILRCMIWYETEIINPTPTQHLLNFSDKFSPVSYVLFLQVNCLTVSLGKCLRHFLLMWVKIGLWPQFRTVFWSYAKIYIYRKNDRSSDFNIHSSTKSSTWKLFNFWNSFM